MSKCWFNSNGQHMYIYKNAQYKCDCGKTVTWDEVAREWR